MMQSDVLTEENSTPIFSFADSELGALPCAFIRAMERVTGQPRIKSLYLDYVDEDRPDEFFWQDSVARLELDVRLNFDAGAYIPKTGGLLVVANHPFGVIDGLILCSEISKVRSDYKILTHQVLRQAPAVKHQILPIDFEETPAALQTNIATRKQAIKQIENGGVIILFPSGAISLPQRLTGPALDSEWKTFAAKLALIDGTTVLPFFFSGKNSLTYVMARRLSMTLGYSLMFREICKRIGSRVDVTVRRPIYHTESQSFPTRNALTTHLRALTYGDLN